MTSPTIPQFNLQASRELTPRDDAKKIVSEVLKRVDQMIRKGDLDLAQMEISRAKELDPRNVYAHALEERISALKKEVIYVQEKQCTSESNQETASEKVSSAEIESPLAPLAPQSIPTLVTSTTNPSTPPSASVQKTSSVKGPINQEESLQESVVDRSIELESYRKALTEMWCDGTLNEDEKRRLNELRTLLEITDAEHEGIEKNIKRECYKNALFRQLSTNPVSFSNSKVLSELQATFHISEEEHLQIQTQLMNVMQHRQRNKILVIDDDTRLLELLSASLEDNGFDVTALPTSDEAYALLRKFEPDLILCDINLETSTMGGFTFYEKVQELKSVQRIPFIFLSGLTDEILIRTGKELGVDDYLMKPISEQTLVSTLRGKLKRFKQLNKTEGDTDNAGGRSAFNHDLGEQIRQENMIL